MKASVMKKTPIFTRSIAAILFTLLSFTGPGLIGCSPASDSTDVAVSEDAAIFDFFATINNLDKETFKTSLMLELMYSGVTLPNPNGLPEQELIQHAADTLFDTTVLSDAQLSPLEKVINNYSEVFGVPASDLQSFLADPTSALEPVIVAASDSFAVFRHLTGAENVIATLLTQRAASYFPSLKLASANAPKQLEGQTLLAKAFSELLGVNTAHAQGTIEYAIVLVFVLALLVYAAWHTSQHMPSITAPSFNFGRTTSATTKSNANAIETNTVTYEGNTYAIEITTEFSALTVDQTVHAIMDGESITIPGIGNEGDTTITIPEGADAETIAGIIEGIIRAVNEKIRQLAAKVASGEISGVELGEVNELIQKLNGVVAQILKSLRDLVKGGNELAKDVACLLLPVLKSIENELKADLATALANETDPQTQNEIQHVYGSVPSTLNSTYTILNILVDRLGGC
ncbi:MAG: hypothetical protein IPJ88_11270 [Myxococcales bacterium]|nr:MAG: hypothetical protein IPJ88_11270 [Myxococcales bacterium]